MITYREFFERKAQGETVKGIAESVGKSTKAVNRSLRRAGYEADENNEWVFGGEGSEPLDDEMIFGRGQGGPINSGGKASKSAPPESQKLSSASTKNENASDSNQKDIDRIGALLESGNEKETSYRGFYLDRRIIQVLEKVNHGRKSELVNEILLKEFRDRGLI